MKNKITKAEWLNNNYLVVSLNRESYDTKLNPVDFKLRVVARIRNINFMVTGLLGTAVTKEIHLKRLQASKRKKLLDGDKMIGLIIYPHAIL